MRSTRDILYSPTVIHSGGRDATSPGSELKNQHRPFFYTVSTHVLPV